MEQDRSAFRGLVAGAMAGLVAAVLMDVFQRAVSAAQGSFERKLSVAQGQPEIEVRQAQAAEQAKESTTEKAARKGYEFIGRRLSEADKPTAGQVVHFAFGVTTGGFYGLVSEYFPVVTLGKGVAFATVLFLLTDELSLPGLRLASRPEDTPPIDHALHWASHVAYGSSLEVTRSLLARALRT